MAMMPPGHKAKPISDGKNVEWSGLHIFVDLWGASGFDDMALCRDAIKEACDAIGVTMLDMLVHQYGEQGGVSAVALIAESHISVHSWAEYGYAGCDIFTCGDVDPYQAIPVFRRYFKPSHVNVAEHKRLLRTASVASEQQP
jgi:S-adenosylmethionine decarboxylase